MKKFLIIIGMILLVGIFAKDVFLHQAIMVPADDLVGLYHPYIDLFASEYPRGVPFKNSLITDPVRQQYPWKSLVIEDVKKFELPLWNPYSGLGSPLLANFQSGTFYPLNILFFLLPFNTAWNFYILLQPFLALLFMFLYLRAIKVNWWGSVIGGVVFAFSGFFVSWLEWGNVGNTILWLPLIFAIKEKLIEKWTWKFGVALIVAELCAFFAGHLQVWFYCLLLSNAYLFFRLYLHLREKYKKVSLRVCLQTYRPFLIVGGVFFIIASIQLLPTLQYILLSARDVDQNYLNDLGWFIPWQHLLQFFAPDYFGNPATGNYWGNWNYGELVGYIGVAPLLLVFAALIQGISKKDWRVLFFSSTVILCFLFALPTPLAQIPFVLHIPFLSSAQPTRLLSLIDLSLAILAGLGVDAFFKLTKKQFGYVIGLGLFCLIVLLGSLPILRSNPSLHIYLQITQHNVIFPILLFVISLVLVSLLYMIPQKKFRAIGLSLLIVLVSADLLRFAWKFTPFVSHAYLYPQTQTLAFLQKNIGDNRILPVDDRILPPNVNDFYHIASLTDYDPLYSMRFGELIAAIERNKPDIAPPFGFNRIITPKNYASPLIDLLGVKYVLSLDPIQDTRLSLVFQEGQTKVYQNLHAFPQAFFVSHVIGVSSEQQSIDAIFSHQSGLFTSAAVEGIASGDYVIGSTTLTSNDPNRITIHTINTGVGFLVLSDLYYPTWQATIDGQEVKVYPVDLALRGIEVPSGDHTIVFENHLL